MGNAAVRSIASVDASVDASDVMPTEGGAISTEGGAISTEGGVISTEGGLAAGSASPGVGVWRWARVREGGRGKVRVPQKDLTPPSSLEHASSIACRRWARCTLMPQPAAWLGLGLGFGLGLGPGWGQG